MLAKDPKDWFIGSVSPAIYAAFTEVINFIVEIGIHYQDSSDRRALIVEGMTRIKRHENTLLHALVHGTENVKGLGDIPSLNVYFVDDDLSNRDPIIAINFKGRTCSEMVEKYEENKIIVCSREKESPFPQRVLAEFDLDDIIRVSPLHCHNVADIERFLSVTHEICQ